ncbi:flavin reductase family protein [Streptomyces sp. WM6378]|uniref:flavin reductase family protein n=1 Tax=Streptomyces sp. WM6378 TaxID=1415557 RepID=UPI00099CDD34|nr:flavin reductase family protein [Streptomyces sp. WM6378]
MTASAPSLRPTLAPVDDETRWQSLRGFSRCLPTGVSVVTVTYSNAAHGATVSTASVVSQHPLRFGASLRRGSYLADLVRQRGEFVLNVLSSRQAAVADWFANPERPRGMRQFDYVPWTAHKQSGIPVLGGCLAHFTCRLTDSVSLGATDDFLVAEVLEGQGREGRPLVNFAGQLHDVEFRDVFRARREQAGAITTFD